MKISWFEDHHGYPDDLTTKLIQPDFVYHIQWFLHAQEHPHFDLWASQAATDLPHLDEKITVYPSAVATFFSPSDISGIGGMCCDHIHAVESWRKGPPQYDCIFAETGLNSPGIFGLDAYLAQRRNLHPPIHKTRDNLVTTVSELRPIASITSRSKNGSFNARYMPPTGFTESERRRPWKHPT